MSVLDRASLEASPLADLHTVASELSIDGYRRLRRPALIDVILERQGGDPGSGSQDGAEAREAEVHRPTVDADQPTVDADQPTVDADQPTVDADQPTAEDPDARDEDEQPARRRRGRRGGRSRTSRDEADANISTGEPEKAEKAEKRADKPEKKTEKAETVEKPEPKKKDKQEKAPARAEEPEATSEDEVVEGVVELLHNGSGFVRVAPPDPSDQDVYISAAQVKRCELVSGDQIAGPRRAPRRSERFASLVRIDTINGQPADEVADSARFDDLPAAFPTERFKLGSDDPTLKAIEWLTPFGRGSRVTIVGPSLSGKTEALRRLASALAGDDAIQLSVALAGVRPEEIGDWNDGPVTPAAAISLAFSPDAQASAVELVIDQARRVAARGAHAVVVIDTLEGLHPHVARRAIAAARNLVDGGSLTVIATSSKPVGGETTVIALDRTLTSTGRFPAVDLVASGTIRPELLVGEAAAGTIASARAEALED